MPLPCIPPRCQTGGGNDNYAIESIFLFFLSPSVLTRKQGRELFIKNTAVERGARPPSTAARRGGGRLARPRPRTHGGGEGARPPACWQRRRVDPLARPRPCTHSGGEAAPWPTLARRRRGSSLAAPERTRQRRIGLLARLRSRGGVAVRSPARALLDSGVLLAATDSGTPGVAGGAGGELEL